MQYRLALPPGPWGTILLDPPWMLQSTGVRRELHYDRMTQEELKAIPISSICASDAHLWLWTTNPHLPEALELVSTWGFQYRCLRTWVKPRMGLGWWLRSQTEHLIFASKTKDNRKNPSSWTTILTAPAGEHSAKPDEAIACIEALSPGPRLELFARKERPGWTTLISNENPADTHDN
jgi:N6-adenosine-specific RNA methylase IME4